MIKKNLKILFVLIIFFQFLLTGKLVLADLPVNDTPAFTCNTTVPPLNPETDGTCICDASNGIGREDYGGGSGKNQCLVAVDLHCQWVADKAGACIQTSSLWSAGTPCAGTGPCACKMINGSCKCPGYGIRQHDCAVEDFVVGGDFSAFSDNYSAQSNSPATALASKPIEMTMQVPIPGLDAKVKFGNSTEPIAKYIQAIYNYAIGIVGILAAVVLMIGGLMWITAGGNTSNIGEAKAMITASLTGLVLAMVSYLMLLQVNPALVKLQSSIIKSVPSTTAEKKNTGCEWTKLEMNQYCKDVKGDDWINSDGDKCESSTKPTGEDALKYSCCCNPNAVVQNSELTCSDEKGSELNEYLVNNTSGADPNLLKAILVGGEGFDKGPSLAGACGYAQMMPLNRHSVCGLTGTDEETCAALINDTALDINCAAKLIQGELVGRCGPEPINIAKCYNTGKMERCGNVGEDDYCERVDAYYKSCTQ